MQIICENPVILINHRLAYFLSIWKLFKTSNGIHRISTHEAAYYRYNFPAYKYTPKKYGVTPENIDDYVVISPDGETYPMYIQVPCGHCLMCRDKKKREWSFRALCENVYSTSQPLFITMTYNNAHLPKGGVFKEEVQLFMKRMRIKLDRLNIEHNIRYFAVGEYGSKSGRPHYHMILWNFPMNNFYGISHVLKFVENCWSVPTGEYKKDGSPVTESLGFCLCKPCEHGAISYVMKYMRKEAVLPEGCRKVFFLSSRKNGGLGAQYARDYKDFYLKNPHILTMTVTDPYSGKEVTQTMPAYFKRMYYPSNSQLLDKTVRDSFKRLCEAMSIRMTCEKRLMELTGQEYKITVSPQEKAIFKKFWFLKNPMYFKPLSTFKYDTMPYEQVYKTFINEDLKVNYECRYLSLQSYDYDYVVLRETKLMKRQKALDYFFGNKPDVNLNDVKYRLYQAVKLAQEKEIL